MAINKHKKSKGFAIIFVLAFIAMIITITGDILYQTQVVAKHTMSAQNEIEAQGTALTGLTIGKTFIKFHLLTQSEAAKKFPFELPKTLYSALNDIPIGKNLLSGNKDIEKIIDENLLTALKKVSGHFILNVGSENCKLNINLLQPGPYSISTNQALRNLFSTPDAVELLALYHINGNDLVQNMLEYFRLNNRPLVSVEELRKIDGFQYDDIYNTYSPYFTVWPSLSETKTPTLNINCAPIELLAGILRPNPQEAINPVLWQKFNDYREKNQFKNAAAITQWFNNNAKTWMTDDVKNMLSRYFVYNDTIYRIESTGVVNFMPKTLVVIIKVDEKSNFSTLYNQWSR